MARPFARHRRRMNALGLVLPLVVTIARFAGPVTPAGDWGWPLPPPHHVVRGFDPPVQRWLAGHRGVDLAGRPGEPVLAAGAGVIAFAGQVAHVPVVSIRHPDGLLTTYQPVQTQRQAGMTVAEGEQIGHLALAGSHCAPQACLHWGLRRGADYLDPLTLLRLNPVRLLPLDGARTPAPPPWLAPTVGGTAFGSVPLLALARRRRERGLMPIWSDASAR